jgi:hypothetical protein
MQLNELAHRFSTRGAGGVHMRFYQTRYYCSTLGIDDARGRSDLLFDVFVAANSGKDTAAYGDGLRARERLVDSEHVGIPHDEVGGRLRLQRGTSGRHGCTGKRDRQQQQCASEHFLLLRGEDT